MRKKRCTAKKPIKSQPEFKQWGDLPYDLLINIFNRLDPKEVFWNIALVCYSWQLACWDVLFWKVDLLDLGRLSSLCNNTKVMDKKMEVALERVLRSVFDDVGGRVDFWRDSYGVELPRVEISDEQLVSVANRTPELREIVLIMAKITGKRVFKGNPEVEEVKCNIVGLS